MFRYLVLGLLRDGVARHGYALMKAYRERSGVAISTGNFYRELQRLVLDGLVETAPCPPDEDSRRSHYVVTRQGLDAFESWLLSPPVHIANYDDELSSRAVFVGDSAPPLAQRLLEKWRDAVWVHGKTLEREREALLAREPERGRGYDARVLLLARRLKHISADLEFIDELRHACTPVAVRQPRAGAGHPRVNPRAPSAAVDGLHRGRRADAARASSKARRER